MEAQEVGAGGRPPLLGAAERLRRIGEAAQLLVGIAEMNDEHPVVGGSVLVGGIGPRQDLLDERRSGLEIAPALGDRDLEVGRLEIARIFRDQLVGHDVRFVEPAQVAQRPPLQVEGEAVLRVDLQHCASLLERLVQAALLQEDVAERQAHADVVRLRLERLAVVFDRLLGLLVVLVYLAEDLVGARGVWLQLERRAQHLRRFVGLAGELQVCATLDVALEVPGVQRKVHLPNPSGVGVLLELAVDPGQIEQRVSLGRAQPRHLLVLGHGLPDVALRLGADRLDLVELREDEVRIGVVAAQPDRLSGLLGGLLQTSHLPIEACRLDADGGCVRIQLLGKAELHERDVGVTGEASLQPEAVVQVGFGMARRPGDQGHGRRRCLSRG